MILFPSEAIRDEETALRWWEDTFARACMALGVEINGAALAKEIVASIREIRRRSVDEALTLTEAARESGYSRDHLGRELRAGRIPNVGRPNAPRIERRFLPHKAGALPSDEVADNFGRRQIALSVVTSTHERHDG